MTVSEHAQSIEAQVLCGSDAALGETVSGGYCGDLLSWVMGRCPLKGAWVTIMSNVNVAAVAHLTGAACVILAEDVNPDEKLLEKMTLEDIPLLKTKLGAFEICGVLYGTLGK